jgi:two-component system, NtrC family, response regulator GlrR
MSELPASRTSLGFGIHPKARVSKKRSDDIPRRSSRNARVMVVDTDPEMRRLLSARLIGAKYAVEAVASAKEALDACVRSRPNLVITDLRLERVDGLALLRELKSRWPDLAVIILTAHGTISEAVQATQHGAFGFLVKPVDKPELLGQVRRAIESSTFSSVEGNWRADIVSRSHLMEERLGQANWAARSDAPVLLMGENGTGKELLARAIHAASARREKPFIVISCSTDDGAGSPALGAAQGGTIMLEEIGGLSIEAQDKLIALLRSNSSAMFRLICTTSRDLNEQITSGNFRQELFYQINILAIEIPPLGRRREDIPLLISHFLEQAVDQGGEKKIYTRQAIELLATTNWPGNVRQLYDLVKQNIALASGEVMTEEFVQKSLSSDAVRLPTLDEARHNFSRAYLTNKLQGTKGNISKAARLAKRSRTDFYNLLARYCIEPQDFKSEDIPARTPKPGGR